VRLEVLPDPSMPHGGSGRYPGNGNFNLSEFRLGRAAGAKTEPVKLTDAWADFAKPGHDARRAIDGSPATWWETWPQQRQPHTVVFVTRAAVGGPGGTLLTAQLDFSGHTWKGHGLGRFRLAATAQKAPLRPLRWRHFVTQASAGAWARVGVAHGLREEWTAAEKALVKAV